MTAAAMLGRSIQTINARCTATFTKLGITDVDGADRRNRRVTAVVHYLKNLEQFRYVWDIPPIDWPAVPRW